MDASLNFLQNLLYNIHYIFNTKIRNTYIYWQLLIFSLKSRKVEQSICRYLINWYNNYNPFCNIINYQMPENKTKNIRILKKNRQHIFHIFQRIYFKYISKWKFSLHLTLISTKFDNKKKCNKIFQYEDLWSFC